MKLQNTNFSNATIFIYKKYKDYQNNYLAKTKIIIWQKQTYKNDDLTNIFT